MSGLVRVLFWLVGAWICAAAESGILARAEGRRDTDDGHSWLLAGGAVTELVTCFSILPCLLDHGFHVFEGLDIIGKSIDDKCRSIGQTAATKGDEAVSFLLPRIVDGWDQVTPWSVRSDACPCPYMAEGKSGFEVLYMISLLEREVETSMYALEAWKVLATCSAHASEKGSP